jgi:hypothetical protein
LAEGIGRALAGKGNLPAGRPLVTARLEVEAAQPVADQVRPAEHAAQQAWGRLVNRGDWRRAHAQVELLDTPEAERAAEWLRGKIDPGPGPGKDPLGWI